MQMYITHNIVMLLTDYFNYTYNNETVNGNTVNTIKQIKYIQFKHRCMATMYKL